ncbi:DUF3850 domain-containing protein [Streptococcus gallinaceus]|uniref:DUF3850 domain-containing protein n=1 Tax=Streptococcus gallinaceus TaxID=165758 RepID=A0ABV2JJS9_9STRE|nr:DUF3850 domain-containing protein [Streptococcus gallinaceus]MCP1638851.1 hypothetical protein [Streptococcus gallinaceus]MCP1769905.1 hypothetical protein [Streptococcus gallinaceus]
MKTHILKILPNFFEDIVSGKKTFECQYNDRGYQIGDCLYLKEYDIESNQYSGREMLAKISYTLQDFVGLKENYIILGLSDIMV